MRRKYNTIFVLLFVAAHNQPTRHTLCTKKNWKRCKQDYMNYVIKHEKYSDMLLIYEYLAQKFELFHSIDPWKRCGKFYLNFSKYSF